MAGEQLCRTEVLASSATSVTGALSLTRVLAKGPPLGTVLLSVLLYPLKRAVQSGKKGLSAPAQELQPFHLFDLWKRLGTVSLSLLSEHLKEEVGRKVQVNYYPTSGDGASNQRFSNGVSCCLETAWGNEGKEDFRMRSCPDGLKPHLSG